MINLMQITEPEAINSQDQGEAVGIDLGTTHTLVGVVKNGVAEVLGNRLIPSVVYIGSQGLIAGEQALILGKTDPNHLISSFKRWMGREDERPQVLKDEGISPVELSAALLKEVKRYAEECLGNGVNRAVITVPAYFNEAQRHATKNAAELAGLEVLRLISEPTAAALAYGLEKNVEGVYVVYDLGGGTFDFSILRLEKGIFQVLATHGDTQLGGDDIDQILKENIEDAHGTVLDDTYLPAIRALKEELSYVADTNYAFGALKGHITYSALEKCIEPIVEKTFTCVTAALQDANLKPGAVNGIILAGGATRMPIIINALREYFQEKPFYGLNPDHIVALGAAHQAHQLTHGNGENSNILLDITPLSLGVEMLGGVVERIIERNSPIPNEKTKTFTTAQDGQTGLKLHVVQGEREFAEDCRSLAHFELNNIPPLKAGMAHIDVTFKLDADGLLTVVAQEKTTGQRQEVMVNSTYGLSEEEMIQILRKSYSQAEDDMTKRLLLESRMAGKKLLSIVLQALQEDSSILESQEQEKILQAMDLLEKELLTIDRQAIEDAVTHLNQVTQSFAEKRMGARLTKAIGGKTINDVNDDLSSPSKIG